MRLRGARERAIWCAAYGAAFVRAFYDELRLRHQTQHGGFDETMKSGHVEEAFTVADHAVEELRRWEKQEGPVSR